jgi:hypothetical protein
MLAHFYSVVVCWTLRLEIGANFRSGWAFPFRVLFSRDSSASFRQVVLDGHATRPRLFRSLQGG